MTTPKWNAGDSLGLLCLLCAVALGAVCAWQIFNPDTTEHGLLYHLIDFLFMASLLIGIPRLR